MALPRYQIATSAQPHNQIQNIVAVSSGKGGVGKSTATVALARAATSLGLNVGILDADIYGPSMPWLLNTEGERPVSEKPKTVEPLYIETPEGIIQNMSIGYLVDDSQAVVWRGPMAGKGVEQLYNDTQWKALDLLLIDLPPGTGDVQLTISQKLPITASVLVTTGHDLSRLDVKKAERMWEKVSIPTLGYIENMTHVYCPECSTKIDLFVGQTSIDEVLTTNKLSELPLIQNVHDLSRTLTETEIDTAKAFINALNNLPKEQRIPSVMA